MWALLKSEKIVEKDVSAKKELWVVILMFQKWQGEIHPDELESAKI